MGSVRLVGRRGRFFVLIIMVRIVLGLTKDKDIDFTAKCFAVIATVFTVAAVDCSRFSGNLTFLVALPIAEGRCITRGCLLKTKLATMT